METVMAWVRWTLLIAVTAVAGASVYRFWGPVEGHTDTSAAVFFCPMHPQVRSDKAGECPICHMALERVGNERTTVTANGSSDASVVSDSSLSETVVPVMLTLNRQQLGGVVTAVAHRSRARDTLRTPAVIEAREGARSEVRVRASGFVERVAVRESGVHVVRGQPLAWVYSAAIFQAQQELIAATRWNSDAAQGTSRDVVASARQALELMGMATVDIDAVVASHTPIRAVAIRASEAGTVLRVNAVVGGYTTPENALYEVADLSRVWAIASVWQRDLSRVQRGTMVRFSTSDNVVFMARVVLIEPQTDVETRTARVRVELTNTGTLRPGTIGEIVFPNTLPRGGVEGGWVVVPRDAVIDTGRVRYVFVKTSESTFEPRTVETGALTDDEWEIRSGVSDGEHVVSRGTFMVDSESRLRAALVPSTSGGSHP
jgi:membrane fusion protein, copper/silver efflux system